MNLYIFFIENIIVTSAIFFSVIRIEKIKINKFHIIFIYISIIFTILIFRYNNLVIEIIKLILVNFIIIFNNKFRIIKMLRINFIYLEINIIYISIIISSVVLFNINLDKLYMRIIIYLIAIITVNIFNNILWKLLKENITYYNLTYSLYINDIKYRLMLDTGNTLKDYVSNREIIILDENKYLKKNKSFYLTKNNLKEEVIDVSTVNDNNNLKGYEFNNVKIEDNFKKIINLDKVLILFGNINKQKYDGIMSINTYLKEFKGEINYESN